MHCMYKVWHWFTSTGWYAKNEAGWREGLLLMTRLEITVHYRCSSPRLPKARSTPTACSATGANNAQKKKIQPLRGASTPCRSCPFLCTSLLFQFQICRLFSFHWHLSLTHSLCGLSCELSLRFGQTRSCPKPSKAPHKRGCAPSPPPPLRLPSLPMMIEPLLLLL